MTEPKNPEPTDGLPLEWSLSKVAPQSTPQAPKPATPPFVAAEPAQLPEKVKSESVAAQPVAAAAPSAPMMDMNVLGAIGAWQRPEAGLAAAAPAPFRVIPPAPQTVAYVEPAGAEAQAHRAPPTGSEPVVASQVQRGGILGRAPFWRITTALAVVAAGALGFLAAQKPVTFDTAVAPIGVVNTPAPIYLAELGGGKLRVTPLAIVTVPAAKDLQLWMFLVDQDRPISLGVLPATGGIFTLPQIPTEGARFVISLEPHGGSPPGKITGDVLYGGTLAKR